MSSANLCRQSIVEIHATYALPFLPGLIILFTPGHPSRGRLLEVLAYWRPGGEETKNKQG